MTDAYSSQPQPPAPGLLSPDQYLNPTSQGLMSLGAGLMRAGGPSETKSNFSGVGDAVMGGLEAYNKSTIQGLQSKYLAGQINQQTFGQLMTLHQTIAQYRGAGLPVPPDLQALADKAGIAPPPSDAAAPSAGAPPIASPAARPAPMPGLLSPQAGGPAPPRDPSSLAGETIMPLGSGAAPAGPPPGLLSAGGPASMAFNDRIPPGGGMPPAGPPPGLLSPPGAPIAGPARTPPVSPSAGVASIIRGLPAQDRYALIGGGPIGKIVGDATAKNLEMTNEGKNARDPAVLADKNATAQGAANVKQYSALHDGLAGAAFTAANAKPYNDAAAALINDPKFYSGSADAQVLGYRRFMASTGLGDPKAALPQEAFRKVMAANVLQQVNSLKAEAEAMGQNGGRIFSSQIELMEKAAQNPDNSIAANRYLTEVAARSAARTQKIADMADDYAQAHGGALDAGFEKGLRAYMVNTPMFTPAEMKDQSLVGKPTGRPAPTHFMNNGKGGRVGLVNNQWVPVDQTGAVLPAAGQSQ